MKMREIIDLIAYTPTSSIMEGTMVDQDTFDDDDVTKSLEKATLAYRQHKAHFMPIGSADNIFVLQEGSTVVGLRKNGSRRSLVCAMTCVPFNTDQCGAGFRVESVAVAPKARGSGIAVAIYEIMASNGQVLYADHSQTPGGRQIWKTLCERSDLRVIACFTDGTSREIDDGDVLDELSENIETEFALTTEAPTKKKARGRSKGGSFYLPYRDGPEISSDAIEVGAIFRHGIDNARCVSDGKYMTLRRRPDDLWVEDEPLTLTLPTVTLLPARRIR